MCGTTVHIYGSETHAVIDRTALVMGKILPTGPLLFSSFLFVFLLGPNSNQTKVPPALLSMASGREIQHESLED